MQNAILGVGIAIMIIGSVDIDYQMMSLGLVITGIYLLWTVDTRRYEEQIKNLRKGGKCIDERR